jgi:hypothetical protein
MTVVSSKEFATNQTKYYNLAVSEEDFIKRGKNMFIVSITNDKKKREKGHEKSLKDLKGKISFSDDYDYKLMRS